MTNTATPPPANRSGKFPVWIIIAAVVVVFLGLGCCGGGSVIFYLLHREKPRTLEVPTPPPNQPSSDGNGGNSNAAPSNNSAPNSNPTPDTPINAPAAQVPGNFPPDIPLYSGMVPVSSFANKMNDSGSVVLNSADSVQDVTAFYEKEMAIKGWKNDSSTNTDGASAETFSKSGREVLITIAPDSNKKTTVSIIYSRQ